MREIKFRAWDYQQSQMINSDSLAFEEYAPSHYNKKKRHFCSKKCYSEFRKSKLPKEEQHRFGTGHNEEERAKRAKCRNITNKAIQKNELLREPCEVCGVINSEAHHDNYDEPLKVRWLCFKHHREHHRKIHENKELLCTQN